MWRCQRGIQKGYWEAVFRSGIQKGYSEAVIWRTDNKLASRKRTNYSRQNTSQKNWAIRAPLQSGIKSGAPERYIVPDPLVTLFVLLLLEIQYKSCMCLMLPCLSCYSTFSFICMVCRSLFVLLSFFCLPLCCLFFFDIRILIAPLVSSNCSCVLEWRSYLNCIQTTDL